MWQKALVKKVTFFYRPKKAHQQNCQVTKSFSIHIQLTTSLKHFQDSFLGGGFKYFLFSPLLGKWSNLTNIFQMGWNHQLEISAPFPWIPMFSKKCFTQEISEDSFSTRMALLDLSCPWKVTGETQCGKDRLPTPFFWGECIKSERVIQTVKQVGRGEEFWRSKVLFFRLQRAPQKNLPSNGVH